MMEMPAAWPPRGPWMCTGLPSIRISPPGSGLYAPDKIFMSVDLPAPFSPIRAWISPGYTVRSTLRNALMLKKDLETRRISRIGSLIVPPWRAFPTRVLFERAARACALNKSRRRRAISRKARGGSPLQQILRSLSGPVPELAPRPVQSAPSGKPLGVSLCERMLGFECLDAPRGCADRFDRLAGDSQPPQSRRTKGCPRFTLGKSMNRNIENICQHRQPEPRTRTATDRISLRDHDPGVGKRVPAIRDRKRNALEHGLHDCAA